MDDHNEDGELPSLVHWLEPGRVPGEFRSRLYGAELEQDLNAGKIPGIRDASSFAPDRGVQLVARQLYRELQKLRAKKSKKGRASINWQAYALLMSCVLAKKLPPPAVMRLIFECLDINEGQPPLDLCKQFEWAHIENWERWDSVVQVDAQNLVEAGEKANLSALSKATGVDRASIRKWRATKAYKNRRAWIAYMLKEHRQS